MGEQLHPRPKLVQVPLDRCTFFPPSDSHLKIPTIHMPSIPFGIITVPDHQILMKFLVLARISASEKQWYNWISFSANGYLHNRHAPKPINTFSNDMCNIGKYVSDCSLVLRKYCPLMLTAAQGSPPLPPCVFIEKVMVKEGGLNRVEVREMRRMAAASVWNCIKDQATASTTNGRDKIPCFGGKVGQQAQGISTTTKTSKGQTKPATSPGCEGLGRGATFGRGSARGGLPAANRGGCNARGGLNPLG
ncbi:hypothetical protein Acr_00g0012200 [Actinidia rufa]|uniref:Uncharacterized protein n=1 Tax=Actinidia rufa TaxID=165716 RepID=A0A7J0D9M4_9ERIC|nr:hypothetical protein Acr_00g0012200 [Actinidia rufa]